MQAIATLPLCTPYPTRTKQRRLEAGKRRFLHAGPSVSRNLGGTTPPPPSPPLHDGPEGFLNTQSLQKSKYLERTRAVGSDRLIFGVPLRPATVHDRHSIVPKNPLYDVIYPRVRTWMGREEAGRGGGRARRHVGNMEGGNVPIGVGARSRTRGDFGVPEYAQWCISSSSFLSCFVKLWVDFINWSDMILFLQFIRLFS